MTEAVAITSALIVTAPRMLTDEQVDHVRADLVRQLPAGAVVLVVPPGFTVQQLGSAPSSGESLCAAAATICQHLGVLGDLHEGVANIADALDTMGTAAMRVTP